jgi:hypothetical protein
MARSAVFDSLAPLVDYLKGDSKVSLSTLADYLTTEDENRQVSLSGLVDAARQAYRPQSSYGQDVVKPTMDFAIDKMAPKIGEMATATPAGLGAIVSEDVPAAVDMADPLALSSTQRQGAGRQAGAAVREGISGLADLIGQEGPMEVATRGLRAAGEGIGQQIDERGFAAFLGPENLIPGGKFLAALGMAAPAMGKVGKVAAAAATPGRMDLKVFKHPTKGPTQRSITETNLRELSQDDAIAASIKGVHLKRDKTGQYVGAPRGVNTPAKLNALRESYDRQLEDAALGADWYNRSRQGNIEVTGDPMAPSNLQPKMTKGDVVADTWGMTSAQRTPEVNLGVATKMINQAAVGKPSLTGTMPAINKKIEDTLLGGVRQTEDLQKLGVFGTNINPNVPYATTGVNDIWHARAWGYKEVDGSIWNSGLSPAQHAFLDGETMLAVHRANVRQINGKTDWNAATAQAAPWVEGKAKGLIDRKATTIIEAAQKAKAKDRSVTVPTWQQAMDIVTNERGYDIDAARAEAAKTYTDFFDKHTAFANYEAIPGDKTGHLPAMLEAGDDIKEEFTEALTSVDPQGRDLFYDALGIQTRSTQPTQGFYRNEAGGIEANPGRVARPLVGIDPTAPTGRAMDQPSADIMEGVETLRAVMLGQEGIGYHKPFPRSSGAKAGATGSLRVALPSRPTPDQLGELNKVLTSDEFADLPYQSAADILVDTGDGITMINLGDDFGPAVVKAGDQKKMVDRLQPHLERIFGKMGAFEPAFAHGSLTPGLSDIKYAGQGTSVQAVKDALTKTDAPRLIEILDSPQVQKEAGRIIDVYETFSQQLGTPQRDDLINWLTLIRDGRGRESLDLIGKIALPAGAGLILTQLFTSETSNEL